MKNRIGLGLSTALTGIILGIALMAGVHSIASPLRFSSHAPFVTQLRAAPAAPGTGNSAGAVVTSTVYPYGASNATDVWGVNGASTYSTASLAGLVANTPVNVIAATSGKKIVVVGYTVSSNVAGSTVVFQDEAGTPAVLDGCTYPANGNLSVYRGGAPIFKTASGAALDIAITGTSDVVKGTVTYYLE